MKQNIYHGGAAAKKSWEVSGPPGPPGPAENLEYITLQFRNQSGIFSGNLAADTFLLPHATMDRWVGYTMQGEFIFRSFGLCLGEVNNNTADPVVVPIDFRYEIFVNPDGRSTQPLPTTGGLIATINFIIPSNSIPMPRYNLPALGTGGNTVFGGVYDQFVLRAAISPAYNPPVGLIAKGLFMWVCLKRAQLS